LVKNEEGFKNARTLCSGFSFLFAPMKQLLRTQQPLATIAFIILLSLSHSANAQDNTLKGILPLQNNEVYYKQKFETPGLSKAEVFRRARRWWVLTYKSAKDVLQLSDENTGELIGKGYSFVDAPSEKKDMPISFIVHSTMTLDAADGGYVVTVSQIRLLNSWFAYPGTPIESYKRSPEKNLIRVLQGTDQKIKDTFASINKFVLTESL